jgi:hypothetical protein
MSKISIKETQNPILKFEFQDFITQNESLNLKILMKQKHLLAIILPFVKFIFLEIL